MDKKEDIKLNIGAGKSYIPGFVNIDISKKADITMDLGKERLPFDNDSVDLIFSYHTLEHIPNYFFVLSEIHRTLKHGGCFLVGLPYVTLTEYHLVNPYHQHNFSEFSFDFFDIKKLKGRAAENNSIYFYKVFHRFHYIGFFNLLPHPFRSWCRRHLFNVVRKIDYGLIAVKKVDNTVPSFNKRAMIREFDEYLKSRISYGKDETVQNKKTIRLFFKRGYSWWRGHGL